MCNKKLAYLLHSFIVLLNFILLTILNVAFLADSWNIIRINNFKNLINHFIVRTFIIFFITDINFICINESSTLLYLPWLKNSYNKSKAFLIERVVKKRGWKLWEGIIEKGSKKRVSNSNFNYKCWNFCSTSKLPFTDCPKLLKLSGFLFPTKFILFLFLLGISLTQVNS